MWANCGQLSLGMYEQFQFHYSEAYSAPVECKTWE